MLLTTLLLALTVSQGPDDWRGFRGTRGEASSARVFPVEVGHAVAWSASLPGRGASSPVVVGERVFVTCYSGYGLDREDPGDPAELGRHVLAFDVATGAPLWTRTIDAVEGDDPFEGRLSVHGYASSTPVSDGEALYVFFGKAGLFAFDLDGAPLWRAAVGDRSSTWLTGSGSSLALWEDVLLVNASDERQALLAFDRTSGEELWARGGPELDQAYATPTLAEHGGRSVVVFPYLENVLGLDPRGGEVVWSVRTATNGALAPTPVVGDGVVYSFGGQAGTRSVAIRLGGEGDVTESHVAWTSRNGTYVSTPVLVDGHLYWADEGGFAYCLRARDGELVYKQRLDGSFYGSMVCAGGRLYAGSLQGETVVLAAEPRFELLGSSRFEGDDSGLGGTPAIGAARMFVRSNQALYCIAAQEGPGDGELRRSTPEAEGVDPDVLAELDEELRAGRHGLVDAMLIVRRGRVIAEHRYPHDYAALSEGRDPESHQYDYDHPDWHPFYKGSDLHTLQSVTKSVTSTLIGVALRRGELEGVDAPALSFFEGRDVPDPDGRKARITIEDLLTMRAGFEWDEWSGGYQDPENDCIQLEAQADWVQWVLEKPMATDPGTTFVYNSGATQLLSGILLAATGETIDRYAERHLFGPLGIERYHWKRTPQGLPDTEGGLYLEPRDLAKIGLLFLQDGVWNGRRLLPQGWVERSTRPWVEDIAPDNGRRDSGYGYKWWVLADGSGETPRCYAALGFGGQSLLVVPELDLIGVFNAWNIHGGGGNLPGLFLSRVVPAAD